jgi:hypothetical protein
MSIAIDVSVDMGVGVCAMRATQGLTVHALTPAPARPSPPQIKNWRRLARVHFDHVLLFTVRTSLLLLELQAGSQMIG